MLESLSRSDGGLNDLPSLTADELFQAKSHLYKSLEIIEKQLSSLRQGVYDALRASSELGEAWFEVNKCRVYTETILDFEERLQPAMGLICDAKCMVEHLSALNMGITGHGFISITNCLEEATALIGMVLDELECWDKTEQEEDAG